MEYKFNGSKRADDDTQRLVLEGSSVDPKRYVDVGGTIDLSEEEHEALKGQWKFGAVKKAESSEGDNTDDEPQTSEEQRAQAQEEQVASGAQGPPASPETDNTPGGGLAAGN